MFMAPEKATLTFLRRKMDTQNAQISLEGPSSQFWKRLLVSLPRMGNTHACRVSVLGGVTVGQHSVVALQSSVEGCQLIIPPWSQTAALGSSESN